MTDVIVENKLTNDHFKNHHTVSLRLGITLWSWPCSTYLLAVQSDLNCFIKIQSNNWSYHFHRLSSKTQITLKYSICMGFTCFVVKSMCFDVVLGFDMFISTHVVLKTVCYKKWQWFNEVQLRCSRLHRATAGMDPLPLSPFSMPAVPLAGRAVVVQPPHPTPRLSQSLLSSGSELSGGARCGVAQHQAVPPGSCQLCIGLPRCRLGHLLSSLKDTRVHSLALSGYADVNWGCRQRTCILNEPGALFVSEMLSYVNLSCFTGAPEAGLQKPSEDYEPLAEGGVLMHVGGCWLLVANI